MADDIAAFGMSIDSSSARTAKQDLDRLAKSGPAVEESLKKLKSGGDAGAAGLGAVSKAAKTVERELKSAQSVAKQTASSINLSLAGILTGGVFGVSVAGFFSKFISETKKAQGEQAQLAAVLKSTGQAAGYSRAELNRMAADMASFTTFSAGDISRAQTRLLSYSGVVGEQFPRAMQAAIDTSVRMGMTVEQAAETVGRALDIPSQGLTSLSRQGFRFTAEQKKLVEQLEKVGKVGEAQAVVLEALESSYGGAAAAARDTLGGALQALQNQIDDLMTGGDGSVDGMTVQINDLTDALGSDDTRQMFASFVGWMADASKSVLTLTNQFAEGMRYSDGFFDALGKYGLTDPSKSPSEHLARIKKDIDLLNKDLPGMIESVKTGSASLFDLDPMAMGGEGRIEKIRGLVQEQQYWQRQLERGERDVFQAYSGVGETGAPVSTLSPISVSPGGGGGGGGKQKVSAYQAYIDGLREQIALLGKETEMERVLELIALGKYGSLTAAQKELMASTAGTLDAKKTEIEQEEMLKDLRENQSLTQRQFMRELEAFGQGDWAREVNSALSEVEDKYQKIIEGRRNSPMGLSDVQLAAIQASLDIEMEMVRQHYDDMKAVQGDWGLGAADALKNYADEAANIYDSIGNAASGAFRGMEDALVSFVTTGKVDFASLADSIIKDMVRIAVQQSITGPLAQAAGTAIAGMFGAPNTSYAPAHGFSSGGYTGDGGKHDPAGIVHRGEYVLTQEATRRIGVGTLERMNRGYASGGLVGGTAAPASLVPNMKVEIINQSNQQMQAKSGGMRFDGKEYVTTIVLTDLRNNGPIAKGLKGMG